MADRRDQHRMFGHAKGDGLNGASTGESVHAKGDGLNGCARQLEANKRAGAGLGYYETQSD